MSRTTARRRRKARGSWGVTPLGVLKSGARQR